MMYRITKEINNNEFVLTYLKDSSILDGGKIVLSINESLIDTWCPFNDNCDEYGRDRISCPIIDLIRDSLQDTYPEIASSKIWYDSDILNLQSVIDNDWKQILIATR